MLDYNELMDGKDSSLTLDDYFGENVESRAIFDALREMVEGLGDVTLRVSKSQVAFRRRTAFAWVWRPEQYLRRPAAPLVLTVGLRRRDPSPRWKQVVEPTPGRFTHHLELYTAGDLDDEVRHWLREAWEEEVTPML
jgi:hypothetical protein